MKTSEIRYKPNAFNNIHVIKKKVLSNPAVNWEEWVGETSAGSLREVFGLTRSESQATVNMYKHMPQNVVTYLSRMTAAHGMMRGPISHASLSCCCIRSGYCPSGEFVPEYDMINCDSTVMLIMKRACGYWEDAPQGLKKTANPDALSSLQKICRTFEIYLNEFMTLLPGKSVATEAQSCRDVFMTGATDARFAALADEKPTPIDVTVIPEMKAALLRHHKEAENHEVAKRAELKQKVNEATFQQLQVDLDIDLPNLRAYFMQLNDVRASWTNRVTSYKRTRRSKGLAACQKLMKDRLCLKTTCNLGQMNLEAVRMKQTCVLSGKSYGPE
jgi:hypothetical protein